MAISLPILFFFVAWLYAMAGFGGGSTYIALLAMSGLPLASVPIVALSCNLAVSTQGSILLMKGGHANWSILRPLLIGSIPASFIGGSWRLPVEAFIIILAAALTTAGLAMLLQTKFKLQSDGQLNTPTPSLLLAAGILLGLLAGVTGIGGGIYLAPVMHLLRWGHAQTIATCTSLFIALNSLAGLSGQLTKGVTFIETVPILILVGCPIAVLIGGRLGTFQLISKLDQKRIRIITAFVILLVAARLWLKILLG